jgi:hypothetical protein
VSVHVGFNSEKNVAGNAAKRPATEWGIGVIFYHEDHEGLKDVVVLASFILEKSFCPRKTQKSQKFSIR